MPLYLITLRHYTNNFVIVIIFNSKVIVQMHARPIALHKKQCG